MRWKNHARCLTISTVWAMKIKPAMMAAVIAASNEVASPIEPVFLSVLVVDCAIAKICDSGRISSLEVDSQSTFPVVHQKEIDDFEKFLDLYISLGKVQLSRLTE